MDSREISFGRFGLDLRRRELRRDGQPVRIHRRALGILCALADAKGEIVSRDELMARLWPGRVVEEGYFADGMVEEIITALSRIRWLFVIARNSSFTYKGRAVDLKQVGHELGVRYVVERSVRKGGNRVRITAQLIEAESGAHLWADHFDDS